MSGVEVVVVSDTHLAAGAPDATANWETVLASLDHESLVIHTGDISADGEHHPEDLDFARELLAPLDQRLLVLPGNHDLGDVAPDASAIGASIDAARLAAYRSVFGSDRWCVAAGRWHLVGINSQLVGSGLDAEHEQWEWLARTIGRLPVGAPAALFLHKPIHAHGRPDDEVARPGRYVPSGSRRRLTEQLARRSFGLVVSGHVHQWGIRRDPAMTTIWAPSTWVTFPEAVQPTVETKRTGYASLLLHDDGSVDATLIEPAGLRQLEYRGDLARS